VLERHICNIIDRASFNIALVTDSKEEESNPYFSNHLEKCMRTLTASLKMSYPALVSKNLKA
jgi:hypothetical protein